MKAEAGEEVGSARKPRAAGRSKREILSPEQLHPIMSALTKCLGK